MRGAGRGTGRAARTARAKDNAGVVRSGAGGGRAGARVVALGRAGGRGAAGGRAVVARLRSTLAAAVVVLLAALAPVAVLAQAGSGGRNRPEHADRPYVVLLSLDGFRADYLERGRSPNLARLAARGVRAAGLVPVFPSKTFPNHYAIATGMYAERHGLVDNAFRDPALGTYSLADRAAVEDGRWYGGEPIWVTAETQGMVAATFFWVGSEAAVRGVRPTFWRRYDAAVPNEARVDQALEWLRLPAERRPHLVLLYMSDVDDAGHAYGPDSPEVDRAIERVDRAVGRLLDGLAALPIAGRVHVVVVSDHGMAHTPAERRTDLAPYLPREGVTVRATGPYAAFDFGGDTARLAATAAALRAALPHARVFRRDELPERFRYRASPRVPELLVLADESYTLGVGPERRPHAPGQHGYDPALPSMHGIFIAAGPGLRQGVTLPAFENLHVYALVAHLLGLRPNPEAEARLDVFRPALRPEPVPAGAAR